MHDASWALKCQLLKNNPPNFVDLYSLPEIVCTCNGFLLEPKLVVIFELSEISAITAVIRGIRIITTFYYLYIYIYIYIYIFNSVSGHLVTIL